MISTPLQAGVTAGRFSSRRRAFGRHNPHVDAGWWPQSSDLTAELQQLLLAAQEIGFDTSQVTYRLDDSWTTLPRRVVFAGRHVKVSGYHNHHKDMITLVDGVSHERLKVMVVPPHTPPRSAQRALKIAAEGADPTRGTNILGMADRLATTAAVST